MNTDVFKILYRTIYNILRWAASIVKSTVYRMPIRVEGFNAATIQADDSSLIKEILKNPNDWVEGDSIREYENAFAQYIGVDRAVSFLGGRVALSSILEAFDIGSEDEVILPAYTCVVVPNAVRYRHAKPVFADIETDTLGLDYEQTRKAITEKTKAIIIHHLFGIVCRDYEKIIQLGIEKNIAIIEDCAHALGTKYKGKQVGTYGDAAFFSTEQSKVISTRMGGFAVSKHDYITERIEQIQLSAPFPNLGEINLFLNELLWDYRKYRSRYSWWINPWIREYSSKFSRESTTKQEMDGSMPAGYFKRMPNALSTVGINQLNKLGTLIRERRKEAEKWEKWIKKSGYRTLKIIPYSEPTYLRYPVLVKPEMKQNHLWARKMGVELGVWFVSMEHPKKVPCDYLNASEAIKCCVNFPTLRRKYR